MRRVDRTPVFAATIGALIGLLSACSTAPPVSPAAAQAQNHTLDAAQAFARGDLSGARRDYGQALALHEALADTPARAAVLLSLARIASQSGQPDEAMALVLQVLAEGTGLPASTRATAHGRAAALDLAQSRPEQAVQQLDQADRLCAAACADAGALTVLRARVALSQQQAPRAIELAQAALALPALAVGEPPTLTPLAGAERTTALRVRGLAELSIGQAAQAVVSASAALRLDRELGLIDRVTPDLQLLAQAHRQLGHEDLSRQYQLLAERARLARGQLRGPQPQP